MAVVGGSGSGKTWLADKLQAALGSKAGRLSLDDFYRDRSHLSPAQRARINFDNPAAIDWPAFERVIENCLLQRKSRALRYDFNTHRRLPKPNIVQPKPIILIDGLWLLWRPRIRRFFGLRIFMDCPAKMRLQRRLVRDVTGRGRTARSVRERFRKTVEPMHRKYVAPQVRWADFKIGADWDDRDAERLALAIKSAVDRNSET